MAEGLIGTKELEEKLLEFDRNTEGRAAAATQKGKPKRVLTGTAARSLEEHKDGILKYAQRMFPTKVMFIEEGDDE